MRSGGRSKKFVRQTSVKTRLINALNKTIDDMDMEVPRSRWVYKTTRKRCPSPPVIWETQVNVILIGIFSMKVLIIFEKKNRQK